MVNIIKKEISIEEALKQRLEFICEFSHTTPIFINGSIHKVDKHNYRKYDDNEYLIEIVIATTSLYDDVIKLYKDEFK